MTCIIPRVLPGGGRLVLDTCRTTTRLGPLLLLVLETPVHLTCGLLSPKSPLVKTKTVWSGKEGRRRWGAVNHVAQPPSSGTVGCGP